MLDTIYVTRHGFRSNWTVSNDGVYKGHVPSPTGIASDPALAAYGVVQSQELKDYIVKTLEPKPDRIYSSAFFRCLQTMNPTAEALNKIFYVDNGLGDWYGLARFDHPSAASLELLHTFFPRILLSHSPSIIPSTKGESQEELHNRLAYCLQKIISDVDRHNHALANGHKTGDLEIDDSNEGPIKSILICSHAAPAICIGRALTGDENLYVHTGTCSMSEYRRRPNSTSYPSPAPPAITQGPNCPVPVVDWRDGKGLAGGWDQIRNGDCSYLTNGEERHWFFDGEEAWDFDTVPVAGTGPQIGGKAATSVKQGDAGERDTTASPSKI